MHRHPHRLVAIALLATLVASCSDDPEASTAARSPSPVEATTSASPSPSPSPSPTEDPEPPEIDLTAENEDDFERVVQDILTYRDWLFAHPERASEAATIYYPTCVCYEQLADGLDELADAGQTTVVDESSVRRVVVDRFEPDRGSVRLLVTWRSGESVQRDASGEVVAESPGERIEQVWLLGRAPEGELWRADDIAARS